MPLSGTDACLRTARNVLLKEAASLQHLAEHLSPHFYEVCQQLCACQGKVIVMGMGKSGHVAQKIAATLASTGTPAFFVHPAEASHGDLGMIGTDDTVMMISQSGNTEELTRLLPYIKERKLPLILITNQAHSLLARHATLTLLMHAQEEACPLGLAPTTSSTNALALGDALAVACLMTKKFTSDAFAQLHPAGALGAQLHCQVADIMRPRESDASSRCLNHGGPRLNRNDPKTLGHDHRTRRTRPFDRYFYRR